MNCLMWFILLIDCKKQYNRFLRSPRNFLLLLCFFTLLLKCDITIKSRTFLKMKVVLDVKGTYLTSHTGYPKFREISQSVSCPFVKRLPSLNKHSNCISNAIFLLLLVTIRYPRRTSANSRDTLSISASVVGIAFVKQSTTTDHRSGLKMHCIPSTSTKASFSIARTRYSAGYVVKVWVASGTYKRDHCGWAGSNSMAPYLLKCDMQGNNYN